VLAEKINILLMPLLSTSPSIGVASRIYFPRNTAGRRSTKDWMPSFMSSLLKTRSLIFGI
jgi:hypothetical protein